METIIFALVGISVRVKFAHFELRKVKPRLLVTRRDFESRSIISRFLKRSDGGSILNLVQLKSRLKSI